MRELGEFTVSGLVEASDLPPQTIRTVLSRCPSEWLAKDPVKIVTGRPGGQFTRYRLTPKGFDVIAAELATVTSPAAHSRQQAELPITLRSANDTLSRSLPEAKTDERRGQLLDTVRADLLVSRARIEADKSAGFNTSLVEAEFENIARTYEVFRTGVVPETIVVQMTVFMLQRVTDLHGGGQLSNPSPSWQKLHEAAAQFEANFNIYVSCIRSSQSQIAALAAKLARRETSFIVEARDLPYFGIAPTVYARGVLHSVSRNDNLAVRPDGLRIFIPKFLQAIGDNRESLSTSLEQRVAEQLNLGRPAPRVPVAAATPSRFASDVYAPELTYAGR
jgi:hypothetical protein